MKPNLKRLARLSEFLKKELHPSNFDFNSFNTLRPDSGVESCNPESPVCGTVCCAAGWTPSVFPDEGFQIGEFRTDETMDFYSLSLNQFEHLFLPSAYPRGGLTSPIEVARRIDRFIAKHKKK